MIGNYKFKLYAYKNNIRYPYFNIRTQDNHDWADVLLQYIYFRKYLLRNKNDDEPRNDVKYFPRCEHFTNVLCICFPHVCDF